MIVVGMKGSHISAEGSTPVPDENVTMDKGGKVPIHIHAWGRQKVWSISMTAGCLQG